MLSYKSLEEADTRKIHVPTIQERIRDQALMQSEIDRYLFCICYR